MPPVTLRLVLLLLLFLIACNNNSYKNKVSFDRNYAFEMLEAIAGIGPRHSGSAGALKTVEFIEKKLSEFSIPFFRDEWEESTPTGTIKFRNVIAKIENSPDYDFITIGTHYDTKKLENCPAFQGANDGGSGTAILLELARQIYPLKNSLKYNIEIVFFDGEECQFSYSATDGLHGSKRYVRNLKNRKNKCKFAIIADMLGDKDLDAFIPSNSSDLLVELFFKTAKELQTNEYFSRKNAHIIDDHVPFLEANIPAILIIDFNYGPQNLYWHSSGDTISNISPESLYIAGKTIGNFLFFMASQ